MTAWLVAIVFVLAIFFARDGFLLRMGRPAQTVARLWAYSASILTTAILFSAVTTSLTMEGFLGELLTLPVALSFLLVYGVLLAICIWVKRTERHYLAWRMAVAPDPFRAGAMVLLARLVLPAHSPSASVLGAAFVASLWVGLLGWRVWRMRWTFMDVPGLDFSLELAGLVSSAALLVLASGLLVTRGGVLYRVVIGDWLR